MLNNSIFFVGLAAQVKRDPGTGKGENMGIQTVWTCASFQAAVRVKGAAGAGLPWRGCLPQIGQQSFACTTQSLQIQISFPYPRIKEEEASVGYLKESVPRPPLM